MGNILFQNWWLLGIKGAIAVLAGLFALLAPGITINTLAMVFGFMALIGGILLLIGALTHARRKGSWRIWVMEGIIDLMIGIGLLFFTEATVSIFFILLAAWAIFMGFIYLIGAYRMREAFPGFRVPLMGGFLSILFGLVLAFRPMESAIAFIYIAGFVAVLLGGMMVYYAFKIRNINRHPENGVYIYVD